MIKKNMLSKVSLLLGVLVISVSCQLFRAGFNQSRRSPWLENWLENPTCQPPCYKMITPGDSTLQEAVARLKESSEIINITSSRPEENEYFHKGDIKWGYKDSYGQGGASTFEGSLLLASISIKINDNLSISELINTVGMPEYVYTGVCRPGPIFMHCGVDLIYPAKGMVVMLTEKRTSLDGTSIKLSKRQKVWSINFFPPGLESYCNIFNSCAQDPRPWKDFIRY
jgi:hypothetical protein